MSGKVCYSISLGFKVLFYTGECKSVLWDAYLDGCEFDF